MRYLVKEFFANLLIKIGTGTYYFADPEIPTYTGLFENGKIADLENEDTQTLKEPEKDE